MDGASRRLQSEAPRSEQRVNSAQSRTESPAARGQDMDAVRSSFIN